MGSRLLQVAALAGAAFCLTGAAPLPGYEPGEELAGGDTTVNDFGRNAFSYPAANLSVERQTAFFIGNSFFKKNWVEAPASTTGRDGLGPHFITRSCAGCHAMDGRAAPPAVKAGASTEQPVGLLLRLSIPAAPGQDTGKDGVIPEPAYGGQLNNAAIAGIKPEAEVVIEYTEQPGRFADGTRYRLRRPAYRLRNLAYGPLHPGTLMSPRIAPQVIGLGLLEAIPEAGLLAIAERQAAAGQGVSGRPNRVWDASRQDWVIGRFGWKANVGSVAHQTGGAFNGDMGITSSMFPHEECTAAQTDCRERQQREAAWRSGRGEPTVDLDDRAFERTVFYTTTLAVPARRDPRDAQVLQGKGLFHAAGCAACHVPRHVTGDVPGLPELSRQTIYPYTDLLLHDMGEGLADHRPDFAADGREWRTPPLWGLGLVKTVNGHTFFLHDGRARNLMEAVLWHGGEAEAAKQAVLDMPKAGRAALIRFLESL
ncbi:di-heme oxidoreductase family protein [Thauera sinica]|uniref:Di-heme oxidoredictase family protein n=1 Tax=Thauera sinica TaxID=2665146 RepID=A0ABW1AWR1_9RHOO|nr:di-heme oxidoredictase family protein [Thauera sp. K11]ATE61093.1 thiol oxidoreductase [Thauera sp. K11]